MKAGVWDDAMERDKACVLAYLVPDHTCRTVFGREHEPDDIRLLTAEHIKDELRMGVRAPDDLSHIVALDGFTNNKPPSKAERRLMRDYLAVWTVFATVFKPDQWLPYLQTPAPVFEGESALDLIRADRTDEVLAALDQLASGAFV